MAKCFLDMTSTIDYWLITHLLQDSFFTVLNYAITNYSYVVYINDVTEQNVKKGSAF